MCREIGVSAVSRSCLGLISPRGIGFWIVFSPLVLIASFIAPCLSFVLD